MEGADLIKRARARAGLTLRELAERAGTSHSTLAAYEQGRVIPSIATAERIVRSAGFDLQLRLVPAVQDPDRGQELWDALLLAEMFPARHRGDLSFPVFPGP